MAGDPASISIKLSDYGADPTALQKCGSTHDVLPVSQPTTIRASKCRERLIRAISTARPYIGFGVIVGMLWRLIWLLKHTPH